MTLQDAIRLMGTKTAISMESDGGLVTNVSDKQAKYVAGKPTLPIKAVVAVADGVQGDLELRPIAAMLELARGTALTTHPQVAAFARRWSILRYLGAFAIDPISGTLHLDAGALQFIGPNQRRVLSEELGIGFGILVAKHWCRTRIPQVGPIEVVDVDMTLNNGTVPALQRAGSRQPDYLLKYPDPNNPRTTVYELLETKGTVQRSNAFEQLGRAVTQLAGLTVSGQPMTGIAVSTVSTTEGIRAMAVDPELPPVTWEPVDDALERWRGASPTPRDDSPRIDIPAEQLFATATNVDNAALAMFGGQQGVAKRWLPHLKSSDGDYAKARRTIGSHTFVGVDFVIEIPETKAHVRIYQGVEENIAGELSGLDASGVTDAQRAYAGTAAYTDDDLTRFSSGTESATAIATSSDGAMMEISIE